MEVLLQQAKAGGAIHAPIDGALPSQIVPLRMRTQALFLDQSLMLLGAEELERYFPSRTLRVFVGTWNMNGQNPPRCLSGMVTHSFL